MEYFTPDIVEMILLLLDPKSLILCMAVCKLWHDIVSEHSFVKLHLSKSLESDARNDKFNERRILLSGSAHTLSTPNHLVGSCNGLVCLLDDTSNPVQLLLINPLTQEMKQLRTPVFRNNTSFCWGFGVAGSEESDDYKVILGVFDASLGGMKSFEVLDVKSNSWKSIPIEPYKYQLVHTSRRGVFCHHEKCLNWLITNYDDSEVVVLSYELSGETFKEIRAPSDDVYEYDMDFNLGSRGDRLCIKGNENGKGSKSLFWVLNDQGWELVDHNGFGYDAANFLKSCKDYTSCEGPLLEDGLWYASGGQYVDAPIFVPSLVSPNIIASRKRKATSIGHVQARGRIKKLRSQGSIVQQNDGK